MCGLIAGIKKNNQLPWKPKDIIQSLSLINHRGPDSHNYLLVNNKAMLGHTRLSIVGVNNGIQPLNYQHLYAVVNGEFYNYKEIRKDLKQKGFTFQTQTDSEILLYLYQLYGTQCLQHLHGEFAFVLYDALNNTWFAARDRFGIRPLNWFNNENLLLFSSEAKAMKPWVHLQLDHDSLWFSQHFQYLPQDRTLFKNVNMVKPAHYLLIKNNNITEECYWLPPEKTTTDNFEEVKEHTNFLLNEAVKKRIPEEVNACCHLSGGIDSSSINYFASQYGIKDAFTISFKNGDFYNELPFAQETSNMLGLNLHVVEVDYMDILLNIPKAIYHAEGLSINGHLSGKYLLNKAIHEAGFKVSLSGEGADEIFMGYSHLKQDYLSEDSLNTFEKSYLLGNQLPSGETFDLNNIKKHLGFIPTWLQAKSSMAKKFAPLWSNKMASLVFPDNWLIQDMNAKQNYSKLKQSSFLWTRYCLSGYILKILDDAQSMAFSVEGRLPFLDTNLVNYVFSLPEEYYFMGNTEKNILKQIMHKKLPESITNKTKQSFMSPPITKMLNNKEAEDYAYSLLTNQHFINQDLFNIQNIKKQLILWKNNPTVDSEAIFMTLLCIASLCQEFNL